MDPAPVLPVRDPSVRGELMAGESQEVPHSGVPDPSVLTTEQLLREVDRVKELMTSELLGLKALIDERFDSVGTQFGLVERQRVEQKKDTKDAVDAALAAAKEAVKEQTTASGLSIAKSETGTSEQLKQLNITFTTALAGLATSLNDLKDRVVRIESLKQGGRDAISGMYALGGFVAAVVVVLGALAAAGVFNR